MPTAAHNGLVSVTLAERGVKLSLSTIYVVFGRFDACVRSGQMRRYFWKCGCSAGGIDDEALEVALCEEHRSLLAPQA
jgi:hypothetical protein